MGIFSTISGFLPKGPQASQDAMDTYRMNGGAGVRIYPNGIADTRPDTIDLFYEIRSADVDRTTTDVAGSFSFFLLPTAPWDELIRPDDFLRIFLGDQIVTSSGEANAYNFASQSLDQNSSNGDTDAADGGISVPIPGSTAPNGKAANSADVARLIMHERMLGKVDRVSKMKNGPGPNQGTTAGYVVSGRSMGSIIQDISLYYNEFLAPLNAVNIFLESTVGASDTSPDEFVKETLAIILTSVPFPQWTLPDALVKDLNYTPKGELSLRQQNLQFVQEKLAGFQSRLANFKLSGFTADYKGDAIGKLQQLVAQSGTISDNSPFAAISLDGLFQCFGSNFNRSFLNSVSTGVFDLVKHLSNDPWNEFWFDLCPGGDPEGGRATAAPLVPSFCLRQRPYNITGDLLTGIAKFLKFDAEGNLSSFPAEELADISASLLDIMDGGFSIFGPLDQPTVDLDGPFAVFSDDDTEAGYTPSVMPGGYEVGFSGHDRQNAWLTLGAYNTGQAVGSSRIIAAESGGFNINVESIRKYGIRILELSTQYAQPNGAAVQEKDLGQTLGTFTRLLANWYFMNQCFLNGRINCRFLKQARLGVPVKYFETRITPDNPYPKMELFYVQGVSDHFEVGAPITTSLTVIRGLRYDLSASGDIVAGPDISTALDTLAGLV